MDRTVFEHITTVHGGGGQTRGMCRMCAKRWIFAVRRENFVLSPTRAHTPTSSRNKTNFNALRKNRVTERTNGRVYNIRVVVYGRAYTGCGGIHLPIYRVRVVTVFFFSSLCQRLIEKTHRRRTRSSSGNRAAAAAAARLGTRASRTRDRVGKTEIRNASKHAVRARAVQVFLHGYTLCVCVCVCVDA